MIIGTDLTSESPISAAPGNALPKPKLDSTQDQNENSSNPESNSIKRETSLSIISGAAPDAYVNGKAVTLADVTGRIIGAYDLPKKTRTIEDKAYTIRYILII